MSMMAANATLTKTRCSPGFLFHKPKSTVLQQSYAKLSHSVELAKSLLHSH
jgi:hypothetical protein